MPARINVTDFDLAATLECGQAFRWQRESDDWFTGIVAGQVRRVRQLHNVECFIGSVSRNSRPVRTSASVAARPKISR